MFLMTSCMRRSWTGQCPESKNRAVDCCGYFCRVERGTEAPHSFCDLLTGIDCKFRRLYSSTGKLAMWFDLLVAALVYGAVKWLTYLQ